jgi:peptidoglycan/LPS O-acetylase OafA/YrhL
MQQRPPSLLGAAAVQAADAVIVLVASVLAGVDTVAGRSYQEGSGIALTLIGIGTAVALAWVAVGLSRARRWSRTPTALTQLFVGIVSVYLLQGHRYAWGVPLLLLACAGMALLLVPASLRALAGPPDRGGRPPQAPPQARTVPAKARPAKTGPAKNQPPAKTSSAKAPSAKPRPGGKRPARG